MLHFCTGTVLHIVELWFIFQCLCLAPTYELALQIGQNIEQMGKFMTDLRIVYSVRGEKCKYTQVIVLKEFVTVKL